MDRIAILVPSLSEGGSERSASNVSMLLSGIYEVYILVTQKKITYPYCGYVLQLDENNYEESLIRAKKEYSFKCVISMSDRYHIANISTRLSEKVIVSIRNSLLGNERLNDNVFSRYYSLADGIVNVSYGISELLRKVMSGSKNVYTIGNFVDKELIIQKSKEDIDEDINNWLNKSDYLINVGRNVKNKNQKELIEQFIYYCENYNNTDLKLVIIGDGPLHAVLKELVIEKHYTDRIKLLPYMENPFPLIKGAMAFVLSSQREGLPNVMLEAMVLEKPIISTDCWSGPKELLDDADYDEIIIDIKKCRRGVLIPERNKKIGLKRAYMAESIDYIVSNPSIRKNMSKESRKFLESEYTNDAIKQKWIDVIEMDNTDAVHTYKKCKMKQEEMIKQSNLLIVYGAGIDGQNLMKILPKDKQRIFAVTEHKSECKMVDGVEVLNLEEIQDYSEQAMVFIAVKSMKSHNEIYKALREKGFKKVFIYLR